MAKTIEEILREISSKPVNIAIQQWHNEVWLTLDVIEENSIKIIVRGNKCFVE